VMYCAGLAVDALALGFTISEFNESNVRRLSGLSQKIAGDQSLEF
jgi:cytochrome c biogenesis protein CcdA